MDNVIELANEIRAGVEDVAIKAQQRIVELETDCAYYKSEAERHNASANDLAQRLAHWIEKHDKETLARADLEAEVAALKEELLEQARVNGMGGERELKLMADLAATRNLAEGYAQERNELKAKYENLNSALEDILFHVEDAMGNEVQPYEIEMAAKRARAALGEQT